MTLSGGSADRRIELWRGKEGCWCEVVELWGRCLIEEEASSYGR